MHFVGLDLAWGRRNRTGFAVLDGAGHLVRMGAVISDDDIVDAVGPYTRGACLVAVDAPLIVSNPVGQRPAEAQLNRDFARFQAGAHPANRANPMFDPPRGAVLTAALGLDVDPRSTGPRRAIEVYPHPATVVLFGLSRTLKYKRRNRDPTDRKAQLQQLMTLIAGLAHHDPPLHLDGHPTWLAARTEIAAATRHFELDRWEDPVDAVLCAYLALFVDRRPADVIVYGDATSGYIVTPTLPLSPGRPAGSGR